MSKDYYKILGVEKGATQDEIKKAFYKLASQHHPDKGGDAEKFKEASEAYNTLGDAQKRKQYDTFGSSGPSGFGGSQGGSQGPFGGGFDGFDFSGFQGGFGGEDFDLGDIFGEMFGGGRSSRKREKVGRDLSVDLDISFEESYFGVSKNIFINKVSKCEECGGSGGKKGSSKNTCKSCGGKEK